MPKPRVTRREKTKKRPPARRPAPRLSSAAPRALEFKVVELSQVDEGTIERTLNEWVPRGWAFDGLQLAMRESSRRPAMAFVFFTREGPPVTDAAGEGAYREARVAQAHFERIVVGGTTEGPSASDAWARLQAMADEDVE